MQNFATELLRFCDEVGLYPYKLYSAREAATILHVHPIKLRHLREMGQLKTMPERKRRPYLGGYLAAYLYQQRAAGLKIRTGRLPPDANMQSNWGEGCSARCWQTTDLNPHSKRTHSMSYVKPMMWRR